MLRQLICLGILLAILVVFSQAECNVCSMESNAACVSNNQYQNCTADNIPSGPIYTCPNNTNCTGSTGGCTSNPALVSCNDCNKCDGTNVYVCTGPSTYGLCDGFNIVANIVYPCSTGEVCVADIGSRCAPSFNGTGATCSYYNATNVIGDLCTLKATTGRYPHPNDSSCLRYIYCFRKNSTWTGNTWPCPSSKPYFSETSFTCVKTKPSTCA